MTRLGESRATARRTAGSQPRRGGLRVTTTSAASSLAQPGLAAQRESTVDARSERGRGVRVLDRRWILFDPDHFARLRGQRQRQPAHARIAVDHALLAGQLRQAGHLRVDGRATSRLTWKNAVARAGVGRVPTRSSRVVAPSSGRLVAPIQHVAALGLRLCTTPTTSGRAACSARATAVPWGNSSTAVTSTASTWPTWLTRSTHSGGCPLCLSRRMRSRPSFVKMARSAAGHVVERWSATRQPERSTRRCDAAHRRRGRRAGAQRRPASTGCGIRGSWRRDAGLATACASAGLSATARRQTLGLAGQLCGIIEVLEHATTARPKAGQAGARRAGDALAIAPGPPRRPAGGERHAPSRRYLSPGSAPAT